MPVPDGATKLDVFPVCPEKRAHRSGWFSAKELALRHVIRVPHLLRNEAGVCCIPRHHPAKLFRPLHISAKEFVMRALADQQGPRAPSSLVRHRKRSPVVVLTKPIAA